VREDHAPPLAGPAPTGHEPAPEARPWRYVSPRLADATGRTLDEAELAAALGSRLSDADVRDAFASFEASAAADRRRDRNRRKAIRKARR
jgi:hypothetical protein